MVTASLRNSLSVDLLFTMSNMETIENKHVAIETNLYVRWVWVWNGLCKGYMNLHYLQTKWEVPEILEPSAV